MNNENAEKKMSDEEKISDSSAKAEDVSDKSSEESLKKEEKASREEELQKELDSLNEKYLRLAADFENFRKRSAKDSEARVNRAIEKFAVEMLEVSDNIERALKSDDSCLREGVEQIRKIFAKVYENYSISPIESLQQQFDPVKHEAIAYVPSECKDGVIIDEVTRGYCMDDKVIRCAKVAVSKGNKEEN
ncbi:nucleotide exchange factor GrpE [Methanoplanus sp. FWC-SCC4]|uniref:Protein GrpE n=1 Tax=Methanochimaera problematica TaxID=2609417 RepID=A0AA97FFN2_9EURY|nr:nucleotide exchange factor GrpE [Methanoplanus sp. FWC-SCC4]WOF16581.1 nucleotide exchange factor GrpE [Methanoplanus sp. FWC-SCC4]